jgi:hypothetical protein
MLFLQHLVSKMRPAHEGGGRAGIDLSVRSAGISFRGRRGHCRTKGASARMIGRRHVCFRCGGVSPAAGG